MYGEANFDGDTHLPEGQYLNVWLRYISPTHSPSANPTNAPTVAPLQFEISFVSENLTAYEWTNNGSLGTSRSITALTGTVYEIETNGGANIDALCFNGSHSAITYIDYDTNSAVRPNLTMEIWWKPIAYGNVGWNTGDWILGHDDQGYDRAIMAYDQRYGGIALGVGYAYTSGLGTLALGEWHHLVATFSKESATLYLNGGDNAGGSQESKEVIYDEYHGSVYNDVGLNGLRHYPTNPHAVTGCFAQIQMTNRVVDATEVQELFEVFEEIINSGWFSAD